jgi:hypothetical protein
MRILARLLLVLMCANGPPRCVETEAFLSDPEGAEFDDGLLGEWYGGNVHLSIARPEKEEPGILRVVYVAVDAAHREPVHFVAFRAWRTVISGSQYLNMEKLGEYWGQSESKVPARIIVQYDRSDDGSAHLRLSGLEGTAKGAIHFWFMDHAVVKAAIKAGELEGRVIGEGKDKRIIIAASREALRAFIAAKGSELAFRNDPKDRKPISLVRMPK